MGKASWRTEVRLVMSYHHTKRAIVVCSHLLFPASLSPSSLPHSVSALVACSIWDLSREADNIDLALCTVYTLNNYKWYKDVSEHGFTPVELVLIGQARGTPGPICTCKSMSERDQLISIVPQ